MINKKWIILVCFVMLNGCKTAPVKSGSGTVQVYKYDNSVSCDQSSGVSLKTMKQKLVGSQIPVLSANCGNDGLVRPAVCGVKTGNINVFEVSSEVYPKARALGFQPVSKLEDYMKVPCTI